GVVGQEGAEELQRGEWNQDRDDQGEPLEQGGFERFCEEGREVPETQDEAQDREVVVGAPATVAQDDRPANGEQHGRGEQRAEGLGLHDGVYLSRMLKIPRDAIVETMSPAVGRSETNTLLRRLPSVDELLRSPPCQALLAEI